MDELKTIRSFVLVAGTGSFSKAAEKLGTSRGLVSRHVADLEKRLGACLIHRTTRSIALTSVGSAYFEFCAPMVRDLDNIQETIRTSGEKPEGSIRIIAPRSFGTLFLSDAVANFALKNPAIRITLILNDTASDASNFASENFDVAVRLQAISETSGVVARKIGTLEWVACASPSYLEGSGPIETPGDLEQANCLLQASLATRDIWRFGTGRKAVSVKVGGSFASNSVLALKSAALAGLGVAQLPTCYISDDLAAGRLIRIALDPPPEVRPVYVMLPGDRNVPSATKLFVNFIARWYREQNWSQAAGR